MIVLFIVLFPIPIPADNTYRDYIFSPKELHSENVQANSQFSTDLFTGAATYSYQFDVPIGTNSLTPTISLSYNSLSVNNRPTIVGSGWSLSQSYIKRKTNYTFAKTSDDEFELALDGTTYNLVYNPFDKRYHTELESFFNIKNISGGNNTNGIYWIVKLPNGKTYRFGYNNNSEMVSTEFDYTWKWSLDLVNDTNNNKIFYSYYEDLSINDSSAVYPKFIEYNNDRRRKIIFNYQSSDRSDKWEVYEDGTKLRESRKLTKVEILVNGSLISKYVFNYSNEIPTHSLITSIQEFGSDNITALPATKFEYFSQGNGWENDTSWNMPYDNSVCGLAFADAYEGQDAGLRLMDVNRDGLTDAVVGYGDCSPSSIRKTFINVGDGWEYNSSWNLPYDSSSCGLLFTWSGSDTGLRATDVNNDGLTDLMVAYGDGCGPTDSVRRTFINNGTNWEYNSSWNMPYVTSSCMYFTLVNPSRDEGVRLADVNSDGYPDLLVGYGSGCTSSLHRKTYMNNKTSWKNDSNWNMPFDVNSCGLIFAATGGTSQGTILVDVNGDNLQDIVVGKSSGCTDGGMVRRTFINNGTNWEYDSKWNLPYNNSVCGIAITTQGTNPGWDKGTRFSDVNGDGLIDILVGYGADCDSSSLVRKTFLNNGNGWKYNSSWNLPYDSDFCGMIFSSSTDGGFDQGVRLEDINGDNLPDIVAGRNGGCSQEDIKSKTYINKAKKARLLKKITNSNGGIINIDYMQSTLLDPVNKTGHGNIGFNLWVVSNITFANGMIISQKINSTEKYDYSNGLYDYKTKEFRGFKYVNLTKPDGSYIQHFFHQDIAKKGREYKVNYFDSNNKLIQRKLNEWIYSDLNGYFNVNLKTQSMQTFEGLSTSKISNVTYYYDNFGNRIAIINKGDTNINGDEAYEYFEYLNNSAKWIVNKPKIHKILASDNSTKLRETKYRYDNQSYGTAPTKGYLTREEKWLYGGNNITQKYDYDTYGNLIKFTDANGNKLQYQYGTRDTTYTYPDKIINLKNHTTNYYYDKSGNIVSIIDSNKVNTSFQYDVFGRKTKEVMPYNNLTYPTTEISYYFDGTAPEKLLIKKLGKAQDTFDTYIYYDGFGNEIQTKTEAENLRQLVRTKYIGKSQKVEFESNPYFIAFNENYTTPNTTVKGINYTYDGLGRVKKIKNPDGTLKTFNYSIWNVTTYDENSNKKQEIFDAYGNKIKIFEFNGNGIYKTEYKYNALGNLILINDSQSNLFNFTYDTLGRKTKLSDPDLGIWTYEYDANGNLIKQTDANGKIVTLQYDSLNRITKKNSTGISIVYAYDTVKNGTLTKVTTALGDKTFTYDNRYRIKSIKDQRFGLTFTNNFTYDSADRIINSILTDGTTVNYNYTDSGNIESISNALKQNTYNELNLPKRRQYLSGIDTNFTYKTDNLRLSAIKTSNVQNFKYTYDNVGNILKINDTVNLRIQEMGYDDIYRLTNADLTNSSSLLYSFNYTYSSIGNIEEIESIGGKSVYSYGNSPMHSPESITQQ